MLRTIVLALLAIGSVLALANRSFAQAYGLTQRPAVGPFLDGTMPPQPPVIGGNWSTTLAFPNLIFQNPVGIVQMPGQNKMVVWEREGRAWFFEKNANTATKTLIFDVSEQCQGWDDSGLLGLAFHPQFSLGGEAGTNRYVFVWYTYVTPGGVQGNENSRPPVFMSVRDRLARFALDATGVAVPGSETILIDQHGNSVWHNGGGMFFHPDNGFLYITNGDDANEGNSQQIVGGLFSGVLRIDVDQRGGAISHPPPRTPSGATTAHYFIPNDNPFVGVPNANEEFFAIGLRSPHRMTIDPVTKRIFISDVGSTSREEITAIEPNDPPGLNLQWSRIEGLSGDLSPPYIGVNKRPIIDYGRGDGSAVIGGYIYRGAEFAGELGGRYIFGDNITNSIWVLDDSTTPATKLFLTTLPKGPGPNPGNDYVGLSSFGVDAQGELYLCQLSTIEGRIHKLQRGGPGSQPFPPTLSGTGAFSSTATLTPSNKLVPYTLIHPFWSDGAVKSRWAAIPNPMNVGFTATGEWTWPAGSVFVKHFELPVDDTNPAVTRRLETRLLVKMATGATYGATYKWRPDNSDADLLDSAVTENISIALTPVGSLAGNDIGSPTLAGSTSRTGDVLTLQAGGTDIWDTADQFHFAHQQRTGDFDIAVRVESLTQADLYTKAGVMARESLGPGSRHIFALVFPSNAARNNNNGGYEFQYRAVTGGSSTAIYPAQPQPRVNYPNTWLRLRREGDTFIGYSSVDGVWWTEFARQTLDLPDTIFFGLAATAHTSATQTTARFQLQTARRQPWYYPSRNDCVSCHTNVAGGVLGPKTRQLNGTMLYPNGVTDNQLRAWAHVGLFDNPPQEAQIPNLDKLAALHDQSATLEKRGRSYLDANCANCHRPGGAQGFWDARFDTPFAQQGLLYGALVNNLGDPSARVIVPRELLRSVLHRRVNTVGGIQMPPIARNMIDQQGVAVLGQWINTMEPNTPPLVTLTSPINGATFSGSEPINFAASASDSDGILKVEFYDGALKLGEDTIAPYTFAWNGAGRGAHEVSATAIDSIGNSARSEIASINVSGGDFAGFLGEYFRTPNLSNLAFERVDPTVNFNWGAGSPDPRIGANGYSVRWSARVRPRYTETYTFTTETDDGVRLWVDGAPLIDQWHDQPANRYSATIDLVADHSYDLVMEFYENGGLAVARLFWSSASQAKEIIPESRTRGPGSNQLPTITLTAPFEGQPFFPGDTLGLNAVAADVDGVVMRVEFWADGVKLGEDAAAPFAFSWPGPHGLGAHTLSARAFDELGASATSPTVGVQTISLALTPVQVQRLTNPDRVITTLQTTLPVGRTYVIEFSADLINWIPLRAGTSDGALIEVIDTATGVEKRFYRVRLTN